MEIIRILFFLFSLSVMLELAFPAFLWLINAFSKQRLKSDLVVVEDGDYAVIVTAYKQVNNIPAVIESILKCNYERLIIYVVADGCDISNLIYHDERVVILRPAEELAGNIKSHFYAIQNFNRKHDRLTIIDSDNLVEQDYFLELNSVFALGYQAVQGVRAAKNMNTNLASLDAANDIYYRYVDKLLLTGAGSSASLSGSGMAFTTSLYVECLMNITSSGAGFDKILQYEIVKRKLKIAFAPKAIVFDEKTANSDQLVKQRARWINTWFKFFKLGLSMVLTGLINLNLNQLLFGIMLCRPPIFILAFLATFCILLSAFLMPVVAIILIAFSIGFVAIFFRALSYFHADPKIYASLSGIPKFVAYQVKALFKARRANQISVATEHYSSPKKLKA